MHDPLVKAARRIAVFAEELQDWIAGAHYEGVDSDDEEVIAAKQDLEVALTDLRKINTQLISNGLQPLEEPGPSIVR